MCSLDFADRSDQITATADVFLSPAKSRSLSESSVHEEIVVFRSESDYDHCEEKLWHDISAAGMSVWERSTAAP